MASSLLLRFVVLAGCVVCGSSCSIMIQSDMGRDPRELVGRPRREMLAEFGQPKVSNAERDVFLVKGAWMNDAKANEYVEGDTWAVFGLLEPVMTPVSLIDKAVTSHRGQWLFVRYDRRAMVDHAVIVEEPGE